MTTNRPAPEGSWDHDVSYNVEDTASVSTRDLPPTTYLTLAGKPILSSKENFKMTTTTDSTVTATKPLDVKTPKGGSDITVETASGLQNWKTLGFNGGLAALLAVLAWATTVDWTQYVNPTTAMFIVMAVNMVLRLLPAGPMGSGVVVKRQ
jgi:hypothetical protein